MITHAPEKVIQTITSRCQAFRVFPLDRTDGNPRNWDFEEGERP